MSAHDTNPHCERRWPYLNAAPGVMGWRIATATEAADGASTVADLLSADARIASDRADSDTPDDEPVPFTEYTRHGLFAALHTCLRVLNSELEGLHKLAQQAAMAEKDGTARSEA